MNWMNWVLIVGGGAALAYTIWSGIVIDRKYKWTDDWKKGRNG